MTGGYERGFAIQLMMSPAGTTQINPKNTIKAPPVHPDIVASRACAMLMANSAQKITNASRRNVPINLRVRGAI